MNHEQRKLIARHMGVMITMLNYAARLRILYWVACMERRAELVNQELPIHPSIDAEIEAAAKGREQIILQHRTATAALEAFAPDAVVMLRIDRGEG